MQEESLLQSCKICELADINLLYIGASGYDGDLLLSLESFKINLDMLESSATKRIQRSSLGAVRVFA